MTARSIVALIALVALGLTLAAAGCTSPDGEEPTGGEAAATGAGADGEEVTGTGGEPGTATAPERPETGGSEDGGPEESPGETRAGETEAAGEQGPSPPGIVVSTSAIGQILTDPDGYTLYLFTQDSKRKSACTGECAKTFPPLVSEDGRLLVGTGVNKTLLGSIKHPDAGQQVTYNGHPLYRFVDDERPGDLVGHGTGNVWFAVSPAGEPVPAPDDE